MGKNGGDLGLRDLGMMKKKKGIMDVVGGEGGVRVGGMRIVCGE